MLEITTLTIGIVSALFVFVSIVLSKLSYDEVGFKKNLKLGGVIGVVVLSVFVALLFKFYISLLIIIFFAIFINSKYNTYYKHRGLTYIFMYVLLFTQPLYTFFIAMLEFFNLSFEKETIIPRFELLLFLGFVACLLIVFFFS